VLVEASTLGSRAPALMLMLPSARSWAPAWTVSVVRLGRGEGVASPIDTRPPPLLVVLPPTMPRLSVVTLIVWPWERPHCGSCW
jgi:hypothetical protein